MAFKIVENTTTLSLFLSFFFFEEKFTLKTTTTREIIHHHQIPVLRPQRRRTAPTTRHSSQGRAYHLDNNETPSCLNHCFCRLRGKHLHNCPIQSVRNGPDTSCNRRCQHHLDAFFFPCALKPFAKHHGRTTGSTERGEEPATTTTPCDGARASWRFSRQPQNDEAMEDVIMDDEDEEEEEQDEEELYEQIRNMMENPVIQPIQQALKKQLMEADLRVSARTLGQTG